MSQNRTSLPLDLQKYLEQKKSPDFLIKKWFRFKKDECSKIFSLLHTFPLNQNKWAEILDFLHDISKRDQKSANDLLLETLKEIESESGDIFSKTELLRENLKQKRYPRLVSKKEDFEKKLKELKLPKEVSCEPHPFFENDTIEIKIKAQEKTNLKKIFEELSDKDWKGIFEVI